MTTLRAEVDEIDVQVERIHKLVEGAARIDPELAAGMATTMSLGNVQRAIDRASAVCEDVDWAVRDSLRNK
ncbi:hypothetical protein [Amycolatopsis sp. lyj-84]|uniref:hypothetical protein n=1 Tax=Amycolatopsis sp. lyj-84 TaxID=2789284 RepID=UPI00397B51B2